MSSGEVEPNWLAENTDEDDALADDEAVEGHIYDEDADDDDFDD